jgi:hypothetical protein
MSNLIISSFVLGKVLLMHFFPLEPVVEAALNGVWLILTDLNKIVFLSQRRINYNWKQK